MSVRSSALAVIRTRLATITTDNGFNTDAGSSIVVGEMPALGPDDPDESIAVLVEPDQLGHQGEAVVVRLPVRINAIVKADTTNPWMSVEEVVEDIKTAIETDHDLGGNLLPRGLERGSTTPLEREGGSEFTGAFVEYVLEFREVWGAP